MLSTESGFSENVYFLAAQERMTLVNRMMLEAEPDFVAVCYLAGVAVECLFHAYRMRANVEDTAKHDLRLHAEISGFYTEMSSAERQRIGVELSELRTRWQNNHRYRSEEALRLFVIKHRLFIIEGRKTARKDALRFNAEQLVESASRIVNTGVLRWTL